MPRLFYFYPENDIALATGLSNYTAPQAAVDLRRSGEPLAMWYGDSGDRFVSTGLNDTWYRMMSSTFDLHADVWEGRAEELIPSPWGWSAAVVHNLMMMGFAPESLPDGRAVGRIRQLSHRRTSLELIHLLREASMPVAAPGVEARTIGEVDEALRHFGRAMIKLPWSSSGRGVLDSASVSAADLHRRAQGTIRRQGSVIVEPYVERGIDCALLYEISRGEAKHIGLSVFDTDRNHTYSHGIVADDSMLAARLAEAFGQGRFPLTTHFVNTLGEALGKLIGDAYTGPLGVDLLLIPDAAQGRPTVAVAELNLRRTMGHVCHALAARHLAKGLTGIFTISRSNIAPDLSAFNPCAFTEHDGRLNSGTLRLNPPSLPLAFTLSVVC